MEETEQAGEGLAGETKRRVLNGAGKAAFQAQLGAILGASAGSATADVEYGAERALDLVEIARESSIADKLALLPDALFPSTRVADLERLAMATLHLHELHTAAAAAAGKPPAEEQKLADKTLEEAEAVRATLHKLLDYHFGEDAQVAAELADSRGRRGAFRVAATLARLAAMAKDRQATLAKDTKYWRATLITDAERLAAEVQASVQTLSEKDALELKRRAFQLIEGPFNDLKATLAWLLRDEPSKVLLLPSMKKPQQRKKAEA